MSAPDLFPSDSPAANGLGSPSGSLPLVEDSPLMHAVLIKQAAAWLKRKGCSVVITDMTSGASETPDAIGWQGGCRSILIECKSSRSDFFADRIKAFRRDPERGMGTIRYYCVPADLLKSSDLPTNWGLLEWANGKLRERVKAVSQKASHLHEGRLLLSAIRRIAHTPPKGISVRCYTMDSKCRATLGVVKEANV